VSLGPIGSDLPTFRYHPDPVGTGSFERVPGRCPHCGRDRTYVYTGPVYGLHEPEPPCPMCIADGTFAARFDAMFTDDAPLSLLDAKIVDEVTRRTPGYSGWQQEQWMTHCDDAAAFLGPVGYPELQRHPQALEFLQSEDHSADWLQDLSRDGSPTAYLFKCRHCGTELANWDVD
jgi:uncharacterized protein CbrC (UPF0167 family)